MTAVKRKPNGGGMGLEALGDLSSLLDEQPATNDQGSGWRELPLTLIDEDENQPRKEDSPGFTKGSLAELAETIQTRGVKSPISVREHPHLQGRYVINHGARRYRASMLAGKSHIPAFVDNDHNEVDQVIENLHRDGLTSREIADFIGRELAKGMKKVEIAKELGKSKAFVTQHVTLLDLPDPIAACFNSGVVKDVTVVNELVTAYKANAEEVTAWLQSEDQEITRGSVKLLREYLNDGVRADASSNQAQDENDEKDDGAGQVGVMPQTVQADDAGAVKKPETAANIDPSKLKKAIVLVSHDGRPARLLLNKRPRAEGWGWLKYEDDGEEFETSFSEVVLTAVIEG